MSQERHKPTEAGYIAGELFTDIEYELERQCQSVLYAEGRGIFTREKALKTFKVPADKYTLFLAHNTSNLLLPSKDVFVSWSDSVIAVHAIAQTMENFASRQNPKNKTKLKHLASVLRAMRKLSEDIEQAPAWIDE